jgi:hypothetical protein
MLQESDSSLCSEQKHRMGKTVAAASGGMVLSIPARESRTKTVPMLLFGLLLSDDKSR